MKIRLSILFLIIISMISIHSSFGEKVTASKIKEDKITYSVGNKTYNGVIVYDENQKGKRPAILVVHEWWGLTEYPVMRAKRLAELGYIAMAVDMYGDGKVAANPTEAKELAMPFYKDPQMGKSNLEAAISKLKEYKQVDNQSI